MLVQMRLLIEIQLQWMVVLAAVMAIITAVAVVAAVASVVLARKASG